MQCPKCHREADFLVTKGEIAPDGSPRTIAICIGCADSMPQPIKKPTALEMYVESFKGQEFKPTP